MFYAKLKKEINKQLLVDSFQPGDLFKWQSPSHRGPKANKTQARKEMKAKCLERKNKLHSFGILTFLTPSLKYIIAKLPHHIN